VMSGFHQQPSNRPPLDHDRNGAQPLNQGERVSRPSVAAVLGLLFALAAAACVEQGTIRVHSINFAGANAVSSSRLKSVLATRESSKLPWGRETILRSVEVRCRCEAY